MLPAVGHQRTQLLHSTPQQSGTSRASILSSSGGYCSVCRLQTTVPQRRKPGAPCTIAFWHNRATRSELIQCADCVQRHITRPLPRVHEACIQCLQARTVREKQQATFRRALQLHVHHGLSQHTAIAGIQCYILAPSTPARSPLIPVEVDPRAQVHVGQQLNTFSI